jgi:hypothetical protein
MGNMIKQVIDAIKDFFSNQWTPKPSPYGESPADQFGQPPQSVSHELRKQMFREFLTKQVVQGWTIEIENDFDAVLGKKRKFNWGIKLILFLVLLLIFLPLGLFYLVVVIVRGVTAKPVRRHYRINDIGLIRQI